MIRHVVLVRVRESVAASEIQSIFAALAALRPALPGMTTFACGTNVSPEGLAHGHTHAFTIDFVDAVARDAYLALPEHEAAGARLVKTAEGGLSGLTVLDFDLSETL
ncbi:MAG: Dabb family protein [Janthinobacterium lividum]